MNDTSIDGSVLKPLVEKYGATKGYGIYTNIIIDYKIKHFSEILNNKVSSREWYDTRTRVLSRYIQRYYLK